MATKAQLAEMAEKAHNDKIVRMWARLTIVVMLSLSITANVLTAWDFDWISRIVAGIPPLSLFITSTLFERMRTNKWIVAGMTLAVLISLAQSWMHIADLAYTHHQPLIIAWALPAIIDVPMLFAGKILMDQRKPVTSPILPTPVKVPTKVKSTVPVKSTARVRKSPIPVIEPQMA